MSKLLWKHLPFNRFGFGFLIAVAFAVGCGSSSPPGTTEDAGAPGEDTGAPGEETGTPGDDTGSPGDDAGSVDGRGRVTDVMLDPPATKEDGWQFDIPAFPVPPATEVQQCFFYTVPYDTSVFVNHIEIAQTTGTHHMNIFRMRTIKALDGEDGSVVKDGECWKPANWSDWPLVINSQYEGHVDFKLPTGVAHKFLAGEKLMLQTHYVNATTQVTPGAGRILVNFNRIPADPPPMELGTAFATNQGIRICPGETMKHFEATCRFTRDNPVTIFGANGHYHSRGRLFKMSVFNPAVSTESPAFYESVDWSEPVFKRDIGVPVPAGGGIRYSCDFTVPTTDCGNPADGCCFTFGGMVEFQEHCNAFVYYYPANATTDVNCF